MKKTQMRLLSLLLTALLCIAAISCSGQNKGTETTTSAEEKTTDIIERETTTGEEATTKEPEEVTTDEITTDIDGDTAGDNLIDGVDPYEKLVKVDGTSADGKTDCYDGRFDFTDYFDEIFMVSGVTYGSLQEAIDDIEGIGGDISIKGQPDIGLCLKVTIPDDGEFYRIYYNLANIDLVFNYGVTYDDDNDPHGYAYYSDLYRLDAVSNLDGTHIFIWTSTEGLAPGYYVMHEGASLDGDTNYRYEYIGTLEEHWPGLPNGEDVSYYEDDLG